MARSTDATGEGKHVIEASGVNVYYEVALEIGIRYPGLPHSIAMGGVVFKDSETYRAFMRGALGDAESPNVDLAHLARNHPDWAAWLDHIYGAGNWKTLLQQLKPMWTTPLTYTAKDFAEVVAPTLSVAA